MKAAEILKSVGKWLLVHKRQRWYRLLVKVRHLRHFYFDMMLNGERFESKWIRILVLIRKSVLWGEIVAVLGNWDYDAKESANLLSELELEMWLTLYWQWSIHSGRRKRGRTSWLAIHVVEWKSLFWIEQEILCTWSEYDMKWIVEYHYLIWFLKNKKSKMYVLNCNSRYYVNKKTNIENHYVFIVFS